MVEGYRNISAWQKSFKLAFDIYQYTDKFPKKEQLALSSLMRRVAISVVGNIAEGYEKRVKREYIKSLTISKGSLSELGTYLSFCKELGYLEDEDYKHLENQRKHVQRMIVALIKSLV